MADTTSAAADLPFEVPDYAGGSIVNLMASLIRACGGGSDDAELAGFDRELLARARHIVLLVVDGLGYEHLARAGAGDVLRRHLHGRISSVFPPTTATAVTTYLTGLAPSRHGLTGWFMYFRELGSVVAVLPFETRLGGAPLARHNVTARGLLGHEPVFDRLPRRTSAVAPASIARSEFNLAHLGRAELAAYTSMEQLFAAIARSARDDRAPGFTYAYWPELDRLSHERGVSHASVERHLAELDAGFADLLTELAGTDTVLVVTADHGFVDIAPERVVHVTDHPALADMLRVPLCGEPRTAYCYLSPGRREAFLDYVEHELGHAALCLESERLVTAGAFGPGPEHAELRERVGDYTLLMREGFAIVQTLPGERMPSMIGMHGGCSSAELGVPLVVARV